MPAVVIVVGDLASEEIYWYLAQAIARSGYVVMTFDPQGHGASDTYGAGDDRDRHVAIQQTAGGGASEAAADEDAVEQTQDAVRFLFSSYRRPYLPVRTPGHPPPASSPGRIKQRELARSRDANRSDPLRRLVNARKLGIAGHSRGADVASIMGARDRHVDAVVAFDNLMATTSPDENGNTRPLTPRAPALGMSADYYEAPQPYSADPPPYDKDKGFTAYRHAGQDAMEVIIRGGTHYEWSYAPGLPATLRGIDMATWYAQAWFDRYLKHSGGAARRLLSDRWRDDPAEGAVDPSADPDLYSFYYRSQLSIHAHGHLVQCADLRAGCANLVPKARDGYPGEYSYLRARQG